MSVAVVTTLGRLTSLRAITDMAIPGPMSMILMADGHNFQIETDFVSDVAGDELVATGYVRQPLTWQLPNTSVVGVVTIDTRTTPFGVIGGAVNGTTGGCYLYANTGDDATSPIYACQPFSTAKTTDGTDFRVTGFTWTWSPALL